MSAGESYANNVEGVKQYQQKLQDDAIGGYDEMVANITSQYNDTLTKYQEKWSSLQDAGIDDLMGIAGSKALITGGYKLYKNINKWRKPKAPGEQGDPDTAAGEGTGTGTGTANLTEDTLAGVNPPKAPVPKTATPKSSGTASSNVDDEAVAGKSNPFSKLFDKDEEPGAEPRVEIKYDPQQAAKQQGNVDVDGGDLIQDVTPIDRSIGETPSLSDAPRPDPVFQPSQIAPEFDPTNFSNTGATIEQADRQTLSDVDLSQDARLKRQFAQTDEDLSGDSGQNMSDLVMGRQPPVVDTPPSASINTTAPPASASSTDYSVNLSTKLPPENQLTPPKSTGTSGSSGSGSGTSGASGDDQLTPPKADPGAGPDADLDDAGSSLFDDAKSGLGKLFGDTTFEDVASFTEVGASIAGLVMVADAVDHLFNPPKSPTDPKPQMTFEPLEQVTAKYSQGLVSTDSAQDRAGSGMF